MQKSMPYLAMVHNTPSTFTLIDKREHAWKKHILSQKLSEASIREFEPAVLELIHRFCGSLCPPSNTQGQDTSSTVAKDGWSEPLNMSARCDHLFFDLITTLVFGENFDLIRSSWYHYIPEALARSNERISVIVQFPLIVWRRLDKILFRNSVAGRKDFLRFVHNLVTHRLKCGARNDVMSSLLNAADPATGKRLSRDEIVAESILMLVAGKAPR
ncbi:hypothetical protein LTR50_006037 [Elasticomyces elasticus]|nr:hypothetical protein LTR50_006037 [Elasticomyces elasticus]